MTDVSPTPASLAQHIAALAQGNREAMRMIYEDSSARLYAVCLRVTGDADAAQDVLQEVYVKLLMRADAYSPDQGSAIGWLMQIARNASIDWMRARGRLGRTRDSLALEPVADSPAIDDMLAREQDRARAVAALDMLDTVSREHVRSAFFSGLTYAELAEREAVPLATVKSRIRRGLLRVRKAMGDD